MGQTDERAAGAAEHLGEVDVQHMGAGEPGHPVQQVLRGVAVAVRRDGGRRREHRGPLDADAGRQPVRVGRVENAVHRVHQPSDVRVGRRRRRSGRGRLFFRRAGGCCVTHRGDHYGQSDRFFQSGHRARGRRLKKNLNNILLLTMV